MSDFLFTDSRSVFRPGQTVFAAIETDLADGHNYVPELLARGVKKFIVSRIDDSWTRADADFTLVDNVPQELHRIARQRLEGFDRGVILTGSYGKTTLKELIYTAFLENGVAVRRSPRSWNSSIGVPLAIWNMTREPLDDVALMVTEVGIDGPGQGRQMADVLSDSHHIGIITPINDEHDEAFESHRAKILEKIEIVRNCKTIIYANGDPDLEVLLRENTTAELYRVEINSHPTVFHALAAELAHVCGLDIDVDSVPLVNKRRQISAGIMGTNIITDSFTADCQSLRDALDFARRTIPADVRKVLILGELIDADYNSAITLANDFGFKEIIRVANVEDVRIMLDGDNLRNANILIFGKPDKALTLAFDELSGVSHDTILEVNLDAIVHNYNYFRSLLPSGTGIVAMVKADAYGMGAIEIGRTLQSRGAAYLAVAVIEEGIALRQAGITMPVMVLNPISNRYPALFANSLEPAIFSVEELQRVICEADDLGIKNYPVHIKLDTGMHRVGFVESQLAELVDILNNTEAVKVKSIFTHLATADCLDMDAYTRGQIKEFERMASVIELALGAKDILRHVLNTAGMQRFANATHYDMARLGIGLYGVAAVGSAPLQPVAAFRSHIISLKHWPAGTSIGYGCRGVTSQSDSIIATIPAGYADGINRRLGRGNAHFIVNGVECPTIGNICMDLCMIDVTAIPDVKIGDSVEIFGPKMPLESLAQTLDTIPYEVLTSVSQRVKRVYIMS